MPCFFRFRSLSGSLFQDMEDPYSGKGSDGTDSDVEKHNSTPERPSSDMETLMKLLGNPETAALLKALAKAMDK